MPLHYTVRPLSDRSWPRPASAREPSRFGTSAGQTRDRWWARTLDLLARELAALEARDVVLGVDVEDRHIRLDGKLRADARPDSPAVELAFDSGHGPLLYRSDRFTGSAPTYQHNVRAIALTLEALRSVDRYGAASTGQQYTGWKTITAEPAPNLQLDPWQVLAELANTDPGESAPQARLVTLARRNAHPDHGGTRETWQRFQDAHAAVRAARRAQR